MNKVGHFGTVRLNVAFMDLLAKIAYHAQKADRSNMGMLQAAVAAHLHGAPMAHSVAAQLRPFLSEIDIVDKETQLYEHDVIKLPVSGHRDIYLWSSSQACDGLCKLPLIDYSKVPPCFPRPLNRLMY